MSSIQSVVSVTPLSSLIDSKVTIKATGLKANSCVTIRSVSEQNTQNGGIKFEGHAHFITDDSGVVLVPSQISLGGTYTGAEPMGLFWSMQPSPGQRLGVRYMVKDVTKPMVVNLSLYHGHLDTEALQTAEPETTTTAEMWYMGKDVEKITVHNGRLRGMLFKPKGPGPFPGVIDMFGATGGLIEIRAAMLASHGFACYALPFFKYDDLPAHLWGIELEYFKEAVDWLSDQPFVKPRGIGMIGVSSGAQFILAMAAHFPQKIRAAVIINGCHVHTMVPFLLNGQLMPFIRFITDNVQESSREGTYDLFDAYKDIYDIREDNAAIYKIENAPNCQFLFIVSESDRAWDTCYYAQEATRRLARHGFHNYQVLSYPGASHLLEVPYAPANIAAFLPLIGGVADYGGSVMDTAKAMENSWPKIIRFFHTYCGHDNSRL